VAAVTVRAPDPARVTIPRASAWSKLPAAGAASAALGLGLALYLGRGEPRQLYHSYLVAYLYFLSIALGALFFVLLHFATRSGWGVVVRRAAEHVAGTLPLFALLFAPIALGLHELYEWSHPDAVARDHLLAHKRPYLNAPFFFARAALYLALWGALGWWYRRQSVRQDASGDHAVTLRLERASYPALVVFALSVTFASFDWLMSLDPRWYSTIFGVIFFAGAVVALFTLLALLAIGLERAGLTAGAVTVEHLHDIGKLLFAFVCFWAYVSFSQFMLQWYANLPEETIFYIRRTSGGWRGASVLLAVGHFVAPFFFLIGRTVKRSRGALGAGAAWLLAMHYLDLYWVAMPGLRPTAPGPTLLDGACLLGVGGAFAGVLGALMKRSALIPLRDPRLPESLSFENQ
jgi:hypothetical protein